MLLIAARVSTRCLPFIGASIKPLYKSRLVHFNAETRVAERVDTLAISNVTP